MTHQVIISPRVEQCPTCGALHECTLPDPHICHDTSCRTQWAHDRQGHVIIV